MKLGPHRLCLVSLAALAPVCAWAQDGAEAPLKTQSYAVADTREVRQLFERASEHIAALRYGQALDDLQKILVEHPSELLPPVRAHSTQGRRSEQQVYAGAGDAARKLLFQLPLEARKLYAQRHEASASEALATARARLDAALFAEIGMRWPLTSAARAAWWTLGDLELERGESGGAAFAYERALETSLGDATLALRAPDDWVKALERCRQDQPADLHGIERRVEAVVTSLRNRDPRERARRMERSLAIPGGDEAPGPTPSGECDTWPSPFRLPQHPLLRSNRSDGLFLVRSADLLFLSTSWRVIALQAYTGERAWDSGEPEGWSELDSRERDVLTQAVDAEWVLFAPAVSDQVVVAALQTPISNIASFNFQNQITVTTPMPERRLFAFDAATGRALWNHVPPTGWDGESGSFSDRMPVAAPPVIVGSRVLAPFCRVQGRFDYHVGCFDLETGRLLWSTPIVSGQRELNMFGRHTRELSVVPLRVEGSRVLAQTQLGTIACLDLFSGEVQWQASYDRIENRATIDFRAVERETPWRNVPPTVVEGVVVATPFDGAAMVVLDLETGATLWSLSWRQLRSMGQLTPHADDALALLGADRRTIYFAGDKIFALEAPSGLASGSGVHARWIFKDDNVRKSGIGRPVLTRDRVILATGSERIELDRNSGTRLATVPWSTGVVGGNLLLGSGELFCISHGQVQAAFDWNVLLERARAAYNAAPADPELALSLARLFTGRGQLEWRRGESDQARAHFGEARRTLAQALAAAAPEARTRLSAELHVCMRGEARARAALVDVQGALKVLREARASAPDAALLRDTLLEELALLADLPRGTSTSESLNALSELERSCADERILCELLSAVDDTGRPAPRFLPVVGRRGNDDAPVIDLPVGLWVLLARNELRETSISAIAGAGNGAGNGAGLEREAAELRDLHVILALYADVDIGAGTAGEFAAQRVGAFVSAGSAAYAPFEDRAQRELETARAAGDEEHLTRVTRNYPWSKAARLANDWLLERAALAGNLGRVARLAVAEMTPVFHIDSAAARERDLWLEIAHAAGRSGNRELEGAMLRRMAGVHRDRRSSLAEDGGKTIGELAQAAAQFERASTSLPTGSFAGALKVQTRIEGAVEFMGVLPAAVPVQDLEVGAPREVLIALNHPEAGLRSSTLHCLSSSDATTPRWTVELERNSLPGATTISNWTRRVAFAPGRILLATRGRVIAIDTANGTELWKWAPSYPSDSMAIQTSSGVALVVVARQDDGERYMVQALDAVGGAELWRTDEQPEAVQRLPLLGPDHVVFLPAKDQKSIVVRDLYTGRMGRRIDLETSASSTIDKDAWVDGGILVLPWFNVKDKERAHVLGYDLDSGRRVWRAHVQGNGPGNELRYLQSIVRQKGRTFLCVAQAGDKSALRQRLLFELNVALGTLSPVGSVRFADDETIPAQPSGGRVDAGEGPLVLFSRSLGRVRAVDLVRGELWSQTIVGQGEEITYCAPPLVGTRSIALAYSVSGRTRDIASATSTYVRLLDVGTGAPTERRKLEFKGAVKQGTVTLLGLGDALFVLRPGLLEICR